MVPIAAQDVPIPEEQLEVVEEILQAENVEANLPEPLVPPVVEHVLAMDDLTGHSEEEP